MQAANEVGVRSTARLRLAELVMHLSDCSPEQAVQTVDRSLDWTAQAADDDPMLIVAGALVALRRVDRHEPVDIREQLSHAGGIEPVA